VRLPLRATYTLVRIIGQQRWLTCDMAVLIFDGDCSFCTSVARHFERRSAFPLAITAWQLTDLSAFELTEKQASAQVYLSTERGLFAGAECFAELMRIQGDPFHRMIAWGMRLPGMRQVCAWGYRQVARNRHRLPGGTPACQITQVEFEG
jgi:predicted DCC family thiol-disulfide oxidoreductase YuxK